MKAIIEMTRSQHMALIELISSNLRCRCDARLEEFVDASLRPAVRTTPGELLRLVSDAKLFADGGLVPGPSQPSQPSQPKARTV